MGFQNNEERESRLSGYVSKYQFSKAYKHQLKAELEVRTPAKTHTAEIQLQGTCDQGLQHCKAIVNAQRTPYGQEQDNWTFQGKVQSVLPENIRGSESPEQKQSRLVVKAGKLLFNEFPNFNLIILFRSRLGNRKPTEQRPRPPSR
jgi:hypothetical protein